jgi:hypothetical protein
VQSFAWNGDWGVAAICAIRARADRMTLMSLAPKRRYYVRLTLNNGERFFETERLAPQTDFEICLTASGSQNKSLSFCLTPSRTRAMNVITNLRPSETLEKGRSLYVRTCNAYGLCAGVARPRASR